MSHIQTRCLHRGKAIDQAKHGNNYDKLHECHDCNSRNKRTFALSINNLVLSWHFDRDKLTIPTDRHVPTSLQTSDSVTVKLLNNFGYDDVCAVSESLVEVEFLEDSQSEIGSFDDFRDNTSTEINSASTALKCTKFF